MQSYELKRIHNDLNAAEIKLCTVRKPVFQAIRSQVSDPLFSPPQKSLFFSFIETRKIQAIYFKIQGTYSKISALYFLR